MPDQRPRNYLPRLQDLQSREAHLCLKIDDFVRCELGIDLTASRLVLGISAGVDSMALAFWVSLFRRRWKAKVLCAHLDHGLRPEARQESDYAARLCADLGLNCHCGQTNTRRYAQAKGLGIEEAARTLRYRYLTGLLKAKGFDYLLTAHHLNDLAEDSLMRLIRGSGWPGQAGMPAWDQDRRILRPFLLTPKAHLRRLVVQAGIQWYEDQSNLDTAFLRNRVRSQLLPMFLNENKNFLNIVAQTWRQARLDETMFSKLIQWAKSHEKALSEGLLATRSALDGLPQAMRLRWYKDLLGRLGPGQALSASLLRLDKLYLEKKTGKVIQFPGDKQALVTAQGVLFGHKTTIDKPGSRRHRPKRAQDKEDQGPDQVHRSAQDQTGQGDHEHTSQD